MLCYIDFLVFKIAIISVYNFLYFVGKINREYFGGKIMDNSEIAWILSQIGNLLEIKVD
ncbi:hypothetical protein SAMN02745227_01552 [Anaerobranca californiensis DSM 14826]|jgi:hypothetical protein|uniref:Uncharacterized protein n=1 Tax=Anaerobranca californiensis DSM 14826 TaxID=1120989 RepID=A0A1M6PTE3_9FIRM|nr:hypothetical protein [Anaerobranca californiensis]SHK11217.1 hypothetical protein SAMN02745227_01552 [Anaerobranca californiensis DSM 14826]